MPAPVIKRLLTKRPKALGLAVPGMPAGSYKNTYQVLLVERSGALSVFSQYD